MSERVNITAKVAIKVDTNDLWGALTDPLQLNRWFTREASISLAVGGTFHFAYGKPGKDGMYPVNMRGTVLEIEPERKLKLTWNTPNDPVTFHVNPSSNETVLSVVAEGFVSGSAGHIYESRGWTMYLINLKSVLERNWDIRETNPERTLTENWVNYFSLK